MTPELLNTIFQTAINIFVLVIIILLIIPKWRKHRSEVQTVRRRKQQRLGIEDGLEFIFYPIIWLFKIIAAIFK